MSKNGGGRLVVVAFDPGVSTGWCVISAARNSLLRKGTHDWLREIRPEVELATLDEDVREMDLGILYGVFGGNWGPPANDDRRADQMMDVVRAAYTQWEPDGGEDVFAIVSESFTLREMSADAELLTPVRLNAKFERDLRGAGMRLFTQTPSDAKNVVTDARLKKWNVYDAKSGLHARDATRHAILFCRKWASTPALRTALGSGQPRPTSAAG